MKVFHCDACGQTVFFENFACVKCGHRLAFLPDTGDMAALDPTDDGLWRVTTGGIPGPAYRLCENNEFENVCNWAVPATDPEPLCSSCRLNRTIPNLGVEGNRDLWGRVESAKRRAVYTLLCMRLPILPKADDQDENDTGLAFDFLADPDPADEDAKPVLTGHASGLITLNIAEADDTERERRRTQLGEPYRTLVGHFRHELAHYYWDRLIANGPYLVEFRRLFGDEREDYGEALKKHYANGAPPDWQNAFVSTYATSHAWEDWAESWAHYMHIVDTIEMAVECGLELKPWRHGEPTLKPTIPIIDGQPTSFQKTMANWFALTYVLNNLNRCLGQPDGYPFVLSPPAVEKLRFIHEVIGNWPQTSKPEPNESSSGG